MTPANMHKEGASYYLTLLGALAASNRINTSTLDPLPSKPEKRILKGLFYLLKVKITVHLDPLITPFPMLDL